MNPSLVERVTKCLTWQSIDAEAIPLAPKRFKPFKTCQKISIFRRNIQFGK